MLLIWIIIINWLKIVMLSLSSSSSSSLEAEHNCRWWTEGIWLVLSCDNQHSVCPFNSGRFYVQAEGCLLQILYFPKLKNVNMVVGLDFFWSFSRAYDVNYGSVSVEFCRWLHHFLCVWCHLKLRFACVFCMFCGSAVAAPVTIPSCKILFYVVIFCGK